MAVDGIMYESSKITSATATQGKDASQLGMNDFLNLLVAQMTNQDMMNPVSDTDFIAQMAQFSTLQGIQTLTEYQESAYAASYAGKYVTIADTDGYGNMTTISGRVESVVFYDGTPKVMVNGKTYDLYKVMEVSDTADSGTLGDASQYINKRVTVDYKDEFGVAQELTGVVSSVTIKDNVPQIIIDGKEYPVTSIKKVHEEEKTDEDGDDEDGDTSGAGSSTNTQKTSGNDSTGTPFHESITTYANTTLKATETPTAENSAEYIVAFAKAVYESMKYKNSGNSWQEIAQSYFRDFGML